MQDYLALWPSISGGDPNQEFPMTDKRMFIERRPKEGNYAVRKADSERASAVLATQREAIDWARQRGGDVSVERVRETNRGSPDKWRLA
jgi:hypothetical protein